MTMEVWAKDTKETLFEHVSYCIKSANRIIPFLPLPDDEKQKLRDDVILALALHDVGKAATGFQKVLRGEAKDWHGWRHEILSASFASAIPSVSSAIIFAILTHHKSIPNNFVMSERRALSREAIPLGEAEDFAGWRKMKQEWFDNYDGFLDSWVKICDTIARSDLIDYRSLPELRLDEAWLMRDAGPDGQLRMESYEDRRYFSLVRGLLIACDHMASGHHDPSKVEMDGLLKTRGGAGNMFPGFSPRAFQTIMANVTGSVILRAPTGSGKTEAAIMWAARNSASYSRMFYVLPNIASINAMFQRLEALYSRGAVGLLHSRARGAIYRLLESGEDLGSKLIRQKTASMFSDLARSIWFPVRVCTPHQILRFSLRGRGWEAMLAEFPNSVFVFDEIHAYDPRLVGQIIATARLVSRWNAKAAFISATMPSFLVDLITQHVTGIGDSGRSGFIRPDPTADREVMGRKRHYLIGNAGTLVDFIPDMVKDMEKGLKVLVVCNTVKASQVVFKGICEKLGMKPDSEGIDGMVILLHSRFTKQDRYVKEQLIMREETRPKILVATQVVEVSLNISYDVGYFEPAPIDAMIQRMGRVNRFGRNGAPAPIHFMSEEVSARSVYKNRERVRLTVAELSGLSKEGRELSEMDLVTVADAIYKDGFSADELHVFESGLTSSELVNFEKEMIAGASEDWKEDVLRDDVGIDVLPQIFAERFSSLMKERLIVEGYNLLVPVQYWNLQRGRPYNSGGVMVVDYPYSRSMGLTVNAGDLDDDEVLLGVTSTPPNII